ncbi:MAG: porphobilinogen synthase [Helicobacteraceae bacterium]
MFKRFRRLRAKEPMRQMLQEFSVARQDLIYPLFITEGSGVKREIASMPGVYQFSIDACLEELQEVTDLGIKAVILFGIPSLKDSVGSDALNPDGLIARALRAIKERFPALFVITDLCFCEYTDHGHCGILDENGYIHNDLTLEISAKQVLIHAANGADMIAPSGMMDGIIAALRSALDDGGHANLPIMAYSTKFASAYYGPFRDAADSAPSFGDRKSYQMDPANLNEAIAESLEDELQGADILMVKPALAYLDVVHALRQKTLLPICVYNVSGEYSLLKLAQKSGIVDYERILMETMTGFKRAGASLIITYHTKEICKILDKTRS